MAFIVDMVAIVLVKKYTWHDIFVGRMGLNFFLEGGFGPGSYYYPIMIQFIFVFPLIYFVVKRYNTFGLFLCGFTNAAYELMKWGYSMNEGCYRLLLFRYILLIAFGVYLYENRGAKLRTRWGVLSCSIGILFIVWTQYLHHVPKSLYYWTATSWIAALYIMPIAAILLKLNLKNKFLETLGKASFNIFFVQMVFYTSAVCYVYDRIEHTLLQLLVCLVVCITVGWIFYKVETPITKAIVSKCKPCFEKIDVTKIKEKMDTNCLMQ